METKKKARQKVLIATPTRDGKFELGYVYGLMESIVDSKKNNVDIQLLSSSGVSNIQNGRDVVFNYFVNSQYDKLFWIDSDTHFTSKNFFDCALSDEDAICIPQVKKEMNLNVASHFNKLGHDLKDSLELSKNYTISNVYGVGDKMYTYRTGFGFFCLSKKACKDVLYYTAKQSELTVYLNEIKSRGTLVHFPIIDNDKLLSEDYSFCERLKSTGHRIRIIEGEIGHTGVHTYMGNAMDKVRFNLENKSE